MEDTPDVCRVEGRGRGKRVGWKEVLESPVASLPSESVGDESDMSSAASSQ